MTATGFLSAPPRALFVLDYGLFRVHSNGRVIGICGFLIRTSDDRNILVDTGFPAKYARDIAAASAEDRLGGFGELLSLSADNLPAAQLAQAGIAATDVDLLILTHTHIDHVGGIADFPHCPILMSQAERTLERPLYWGTVQPLDWPEREYLLIDSDTQLGPGLRVLHVPGHAPGQLALEVDLPETGPVLLTSDAISRPAELAEGFAGSWDVSQAQASGARLMQRATDRGAFVIYGHCPQQWPTLRKAPVAYC
jgi:N-acyl homoserine lactone hydrolase